MSHRNDVSVLVAATARNLADFFVGCARETGHRTAEWEDVRACDRQMHDPIVNGALLTRPLSPGSEEHLSRRLHAFYTETDSPWLLWCAWPTPDLATCGLQMAGIPPIMLRAPDSDLVIRPAELTIAEVSTPDQMVEHVATLWHAYPIHHPREDTSVAPFGAGNIGGICRFWNGYVEETCVAVSSACVSHGVVVVTTVATVNAARGHGYGAALTDVAARCHPGLPVLLSASDKGKPVYERMGFYTIGEFTIWEHGES